MRCHSQSTRRPIVLRMYLVINNVFSFFPSSLAVMEFQCAIAQLQGVSLSIYWQRQYCMDRSQSFSCLLNFPGNVCPGSDGLGRHLASKILPVQEVTVHEVS